MTQATIASANGVTRVPRGVLNLLVGLFFSGLLVFVGAWATIVWNTARTAEVKNVEQDQRLKTVEEVLQGMDRKLDRLIERGR